MPVIEATAKGNASLDAVAADALKDHPGINARLVDDAIVQVGEVNIGMAVAIEGGLVVPVVRGADALGLAELAGVTRDLAERARTGGLAMADLEGGTFTVNFNDAGIVILS